MRKKPEYKIIWTAPPDPEKIMEAFGRVWCEAHDMEFVGVYKVGDAVSGGETA